MSGRAPAFEYILELGIVAQPVIADEQPGVRADDVNYIGAFEQTLAAEAQRRRVDGVVCGHIHHAVIHDSFGIRYVNCGDWVESCTAGIGRTL